MAGKKTAAGGAQESAAPPAPWQKGYDLAELKERSAVFAEHDEGLILGAFTGVNERAVADWLAAGKLAATHDGPIGERPVVLAATWEAERRVPVRDFTGDVLASHQPGDRVVRRIAYRGPQGEQKAAALVDSLGASSGRLWLEAFVEHPGDQKLVQLLGLERVGTKIPASSELIGIYVGGKAPELQPRLPEEQCTLTKLPIRLKGEPGWLPLEFEDHYSSKNKRSSWAALALRGYADPAASDADARFIAKPAEMSKKWKSENPEKLEWELRDTPLRERLAWLAPIIDYIPGEKHRIRLMRLAPGGGELARHADNTDPDAGVMDARLLRVHIPLVTNPGVIFEAWRLDGQKVSAHMAQGEAWVLDTRKPHTAVNNGEAERIHLVIDVESGERLRSLLRRGAEAGGPLDLAEAEEPVVERSGEARLF